jgi:hypothetical protein
MNPVKRFLMALSVAVLLCVPVALIGEALDFSGWAYFAALMAVGVLATLVDREGFYGSSPPR